MFLVKALMIIAFVSIATWYGRAPGLLLSVLFCCWLNSTLYNVGANPRRWMSWIVFGIFGTCFSASVASQSLFGLNELSEIAGWLNQSAGLMGPLDEIVAVLLGTDNTSDAALIKTLSRHGTDFRSFYYSIYISYFVGLCMYVLSLPITIQLSEPALTGAEIEGDTSPETRQKEFWVLVLLLPGILIAGLILFWGFQAGYLPKYSTGTVTRAGLVSYLIWPIASLSTYAATVGFNTYKRRFA